MIATLIAAVTLSLKSPSDYTFTTPGTTNLTGVGMGPTPSYAIVRGEDISFLREAYVIRLFEVSQLHRVLTADFQGRTTTP